MEGKTLRGLAGGLPVLEFAGDVDRPLTAIAYDSRDAREGCLFVALDGMHVDGHRFIADAVKRGAAAVVLSKPIDAPIPGIGYARVENARSLLSPLSAAFYDNPSRFLRVIGVTGTDGKSSTVWFIQKLLEARGKRSGFLSTVSFQTGSEAVKNPFRQSTPEAPEIHGMLSDMRQMGKEFAVVEATSHGLSARTNRLGDVLFDAAVMTNVTHEHMEFHGTFAQYRSDKANLFRALSRSRDKGIDCPRFGVVNADDPSHGYFKECTQLPVYAYSLRGPADLVARDVSMELSGSSFIMERGGIRRQTRIRVPGPFQVENVLAACLTVSRALSEDPLELAELLPGLSGVKGRMERIDLGQPFSVILDYAHTPGAFQKLLPWIRPLTLGRLFVVFGSAGERDREKRSMQGRLADENSDVVVVTDEDPRGEDSMTILRDIASGCAGKREGKDLFLIADRPGAIRHAFSLAAPGDTVLMLGKGHEGSIIHADGPHAYDEREEAEKALREMGFGSTESREKPGR